MSDDEDLPTGEQLVQDQQPPNRYAVPLAVLVGGAAVPLAEQTTEQPVGEHHLASGGGGAVDGGDGD